MTMLSVLGCRSPNPPTEEGFKRVVMCSGKVYYELAKKRAELKKEKEVAIIRLEQVLLLQLALHILLPGPQQHC